MDPDSFVKLPIPPVPNAKTAAHSSTYHDPPLDGSLTVPELWDWHLEYSPNHPLFQYAEEDESITTITWSQAARAMHSAGRLIDSQLRRREPRQIIAIYAAPDYITYLLVVMGIMRLGHAAFFISPRNSAAAVAHLLSEVGATHMIVGIEDNLKNNANAALEELKGKGANVPDVSQVPTFHEIYGPSLRSDFELLPHTTIDVRDRSVILHTSGSTAFPKPVPMTHYRLLLWCIACFFNDISMVGTKMSTHAVPMFHAMGFIVPLWATVSGLIVTTFKPRSPPLPVTATAVLKWAKVTKTNRIMTVATFIEEWSRDPESFPTLKELDGVLYGGAPLAKEAGDLLVAQGVPLNNCYGSAECGGMTPTLIHPGSRGKEWEYLTFNGHVRVKLVPDETGTLVQPYVLVGPYTVPNVFNATIDGEPAFAISDWLSLHPTKPGYWKVMDRVDNQIVHSTGEKTNPGPLETILNQDPRVMSSLMFGHGKFNAGILVDPRPEYAFEPSDEIKLAQFRNDIWPSIEKMNAFAPQHSRVFKEMILVASPSKPVEYTAKLTPRRGATLNAYAPEIEKIYATVDVSAQSDLAPPTTWDADNTKYFVRAMVTKVLGRTVSDTDDIFQHGCDSLQATWIRNALNQAIKHSSAANVRHIPESIVYDKPTVESLAAFVALLTTKQVPLASTTGVHDKAALMQAMVQKYTADFPEHKASAPTPALDVVLLTGGTGGLGASVLARLSQSPGVARVYALGRKGYSSLEQRQRKVFVDRGYDPALLDGDKVQVLEADLSKPDFGLQPEMFAKIQNSITHIMHIAYRVNWSLSLSSFEGDIRTVRHFIDLALSSPHQSPPSILFSSSVAVMTNVPADKAASEEPVPPEIAVANGYSESKWVCEKILESAASTTPLRSVVVRVGQVAGSPSGAWNTSEWLPSLVRSSVHLKAFPTVDQIITWIPADAAAKALLDMRSSTEPVLHLAHPRPVSAAFILSALAKELAIPIVSLSEWVDRLEKSAVEFGAGREEEVVRVNPGLRLLDFFKGARHSSKSSSEAFGSFTMSMSKAVAVAGSLHENSLPLLNEDDARSWVAYWKRVDFL